MPSTREAWGEFVKHVEALRAVLRNMTEGEEDAAFASDADLGRPLRFSWALASTRSRRAREMTEPAKTIEQRFAEIVAEVRRAERARIAAILNHAHAAGRRTLAEHMAFNDQRADRRSLAVLSVAGKAQPPVAPRCRLQSNSVLAIDGRRRRRAACTALGEGAPQARRAGAGAAVLREFDRQFAPCNTP